MGEAWRGSAGHCYHLRSVVSVLLGPLSGALNCTVLIVFPVIGHSLIQRVINVRCGHQSLDRQENGFDLKCGTPFGLEDVEANAAKSVDVRVVDLRAEEHLGWDERVLLGEEQFQVEQTTFVGAVGWSGNFDQEMTSVCGRGLRVDANDGFGSQALRLLHDSWWDRHNFTT